MHLKYVAKKKNKIVIKIHPRPEKNIIDYLLPWHFSYIFT